MAAEEEKKEQRFAEDKFNVESKDQLEHERGMCMTKNCAVRKYFLVLQECEKRIYSKSYTAETCHQETVDLMHALDKCVADKAFVKIRIDTSEIVNVDLVRDDSYEDSFTGNKGREIDVECNFWSNYF